MKINSHEYKVNEGDLVDLDQRATLVDPVYQSKSDYHDMMDELTKKMSKLQRLHYAANRYSLLLIFQAMDAAGKDGAIRHVMSGINPQGCQVYSFKHPSVTELDHDFLWRSNQVLPERGKIGIFNRSYYEEVLIVRVHPEILAGQRLPEEVLSNDDIWAERFHSIREHERHLYHNGTRILKFFLHLSADEQRKRFLDRIDNPKKNWKFSKGDITERQFWPQYMSAYGECITHTSKVHAPWYIVPADDKKNARLIISDIIVNTLEGLDMHYPEANETRKKELQVLRKQLGE